MSSAMAGGCPAEALAPCIRCAVARWDRPGAGRAACGAFGFGGSWPGSLICGLFAADIAGFTRPERDDEMQLHLRDSLYRMVERAFNGSGLPWDACLHEDRGDCVFVVVPPIIAVAGLVDPLPERLRALIRSHNRYSSAEARIQLRTAMHVGGVHRDEHGFAGDAVNQLFGLLDAPRFKQLLEQSGCELASITSDYVYETVILRHRTLADPSAFQPVMLAVKHTTVKAWVHLPGLTEPAAPALPSLRRPA
jgi:hypothetical protein